MLGYSDEQELIGRQMMDISHPEDISKCLKPIKQVLKNEISSYPLETRYLKKDGDSIWGNLTFSFFRNGDKNPLHFLGMVENITQRKQIETALEKEHDKFVNILEAMENGVYIVNQEYVIEYINPALKREFGPTKGRKCYQYFHDRQAVCPWCVNKKVFAGESCRWEWYSAKRNKYYDLFDTPIKNKDGTFSKFEIFHDITAHKLAEKALKKSQQQYENLVHSLDGIIWEGNSKTFQFSFISPAAERLLGYPLEDWLNQPTFWVDHLYPEDRTWVPAYCAEQTLKKQSYEFEYRMIAADNRIVWLRDLVSVVLDSGQLVKLCGVMLDITQWKQAENTLKQAKEEAESLNRAKSEFIANMSHEIRTPLNAILGFSEILFSQITDQKQQHYLKMIKTAGKNLLKLINDILDLSKIEAGCLEIQYDAVDPHSIFDELEQMFTTIIINKKLDFIINVDQHLAPALILDEARLRQVLFNLIGNAVKFTEEGYIKLTAKTVSLKNHRHVNFIISIADTGIGIPDDQQEIIFESFRQQERQEIKKYEGTGLGLSITKRLVEMMNGHILVRSTVGKGSVFEITLRNVEIFPFMPVNSNDMSFHWTDVSFEKARILIVDDTLSNRRLIKEWLSEANLEVIEAENGREALLLAQQYQPALILMDIRMPIMDGYEATKQLKKQQSTAHIPIIAVTASVKTNDSVTMKAFGFNGYLFKPVKTFDLFNELSFYLKSSKKEPKPVDQPVISKNNLTLTHLTLIDKTKLPDLISTLREKIMPIWQDVRGVIEIEAINHFIDQISLLGKEYEWQDLTHYADTLRELVQNFDIIAVNKTLNEFPQMIEPLLNH